MFAGKNAPKPKKGKNSSKPLSPKQQEKAEDVFREKRKDDKKSRHTGDTSREPVNMEALKPRAEGENDLIDELS